MITTEAPQARISKEFRAFTAMCMAAAAISIDLILPAFGRIREGLNLDAASSGTAGLITAFFVGLALGQIPAGMAADRWGRLAVVRWSCALFVVGAIGCLFAPSLGLLLLFRFVWGLGAAGMRTCAVAMIRDRFSGPAMGREMAFAMTIFLVVPVIAPILGSVLMNVMHWRGLFVVCAVFGLVILWWQSRLPETLHVNDRQPMQLGQVWVATKAIANSRTAAGYFLATLPIFGVFASYLGSFERIMGDGVFHRTSLFPIIFGLTAAGMGAVSFVVGRNVERIGMHRMIRILTAAYLAASLVAMVVARQSGGTPNFWLYMVLLAAVLMASNSLFPQLNSGSMMPVGHVAGAAAAVMGTASTLVGAIVGAVIDHAFDGTVNPLATAFFVASVLAAACILLARRRGSAH